MKCVGKGKREESGLSVVEYRWTSVAALVWSCQSFWLLLDPHIWGINNPVNIQRIDGHHILYSYWFLLSLIHLPHWILKGIFIYTDYLEWWECLIGVWDLSLRASQKRTIPSLTKCFLPIALDYLVKGLTLFHSKILNLYKNVFSRHSICVCHFQHYPFSTDFQCINYP